MRITIKYGLLVFATLAIAVPIKATTLKNTEPAVESISESQTFKDAPAAPKLPLDWSKHLEEHHEAITTDKTQKQMPTLLMVLCQFFSR